MTDTPTPRIVVPTGSPTPAEQAAAAPLRALLGVPALRSIRVFGTASPYWAGMDRVLRAAINHNEEPS